MFMSDVNDVKIYNLSAGKALPDWLTDRKRRSLLNKHVDLRRRIELIQDFDMPGVSTSIRLSPDNQYVLVTGTYKPRVKCYELSNLSIKFERCFDSEVTTFEILGEDYGKMAFLQCDRFVEIHAAHGRHYRLRIPRFGRDMSYHIPTCDLFLVGTSPEIYRLNLERGQFLQSLETSSSCINASVVNPEHHLLCVGTQEGTVEAWDPRDRQKCGTLDVAMNISNYKLFPSVTALNFKNGLQMAVGTAAGQVLIFDIRAREPLIVKDHMNKLPIKRIAFNTDHNSVYSMDAAMLKVWDETTGKQTAFIESQSDFNDFCTIPGSGMFFFAQEDLRMLTYYIPSLGPAPRWCSFLDNLTEDLETENMQNIYDDYKFVTRQELQALGLEHLEGTALLRAYMHGFFIDLRLYKKAKAVVDPFSFEQYRKDKIRKQLEADLPQRLVINSKLPKVNQELALRVMEEAADAKTSKKKSKGPTLLEDDRFKVMFENADFAIDKNADEYKMLTPILSRLEKTKAKNVHRNAELAEQLQQMQEEGKVMSSDDDFFSERDESSDDEDERQWTKDMKKQYKQLSKEKRQRENAEDIEKLRQDDNEPAMVEVPEMQEFNVREVRPMVNMSSLGDRVGAEVNLNVRSNGSIGNKQMTFETKTSAKELKRRAEQMRKHREERKKLIRPTTSLHLKKYIPK